MAAELSPYAQDLLRLLIGAGSGDDPLLRQPVDGSRLSDRDLGVLLVAAFRALENSTLAWIRMGIESTGHERQPVYTTESCRDALSALVERVVAAPGRPAGVRRFLAPGDLLAEDDKITDPSIRAQLARR